MTAALLRKLLPLILLASGCSKRAPLRDAGDCAVYPSGAYDFGEVGIGTCISGPSDIAFRRARDGSTALLVTNSNPFLLFTGGSLLSIPFDQVDTTTDRNLVSDLDATAFGLPSFAGPLAITVEDLGLVGVHYSEDARTRIWDDQVYLADLSNPLQPVGSNRGDDGGDTVAVQSDPVAIAYDSTSGYAFVANRTDHAISILDTTTTPVSIVPPFPVQTVSSAVFHDADESGSTASLAEITVDDSSLIPSDDWTLKWVPGTWRLWASDLSELRRWDSTDEVVFTPSNLGVELSASDAGVSEILDPAFYVDAQADALLYFSDGTDIRLAQSDSYLGDWELYPTAVLQGRATSWDAILTGPMVITDGEVDWMFYAGSDGGPPSIGAATSTDDLSWTRVGDPVLEPASDFDAEGVSNPYVVWDADAGVWTMFYSAYDGSRWTIGRATSGDLETWTAGDTPVFEGDGVDVAAPVVSVMTGRWAMWYARRDGQTWSLGEAESTDGLHWTDLGRVVDLSGYLDDAVLSGDTPVAPALQAAPSAEFSISGVAAGNLFHPATPGETFTSSTYGWSLTVLAGFQLDIGDAGASSDGGIRVDSIAPDDGLAWLTLTSSAGVKSIGVAQLDADGTLVPQEDPVFEASGTGFDADGVFSPVVWNEGSEWRMLYAGEAGEAVTVGLATSPDGIEWTRQGQVLGLGSGWDAAQVVPGSIQMLEQGVIRLWYTGSDGSNVAIGTATSTDDGATFERDSSSPAFETGTPGEWDDSGVKDPFVVETDDGLQLFYAGYDGTEWRIGSAFEATDSTSFVRATSPVTGETRPVIDNADSFFHPDGCWRPVAVQTDSGWKVWYAGAAAGKERAGLAIGEAADQLHRQPRLPTLGDSLTFDTRRGDPSATAIPLDETIDGITFSGGTIHALAVDEDRGFLYAVGNRLPYIYVIDIRDDSDSSTDFDDVNYLQIEAVLSFEATTSTSGFREVLPVPGTDTLFALHHDPEAVYIIDLSSLDDERFPRVIYDTLEGVLPAPRGSSRDEGATTAAHVGPGQMALDPDGQRLFVTNFNANSIGVYDLTLGPYGQMIDQVKLVGENPYAIAISPDGTRAAFGNYVGDIDENNLALSTIGVLDIDETSSTYLQVLTWIADR